MGKEQEKIGDIIYETLKANGIKQDRAFITHLTSEALYKAGYRKPLDRPELGKRLRKAISTLGAGILIILHPIGKLKGEDKKKYNEICQLVYDQILALIGGE